MENVPVETSLLLRVVGTALSSKASGAAAVADEGASLQYEVRLKDLDIISTALDLVQPAQVSVKTACKIWHEIHGNGRDTGYPIISTISENLRASYRHLKKQEMRLWRSSPISREDMPVPSPEADDGAKVMAEQPPNLSITPPVPIDNNGIVHDRLHRTSRYPPWTDG